MCGIVGLLSNDTLKDTSTIINLNIALSSMHNRGPDAHGVLQGEKFAFAHARLSIQDISDSAQQPMVSQCGNYILVFNGEIYNFNLLKDKLIKTHNIKFRSTSDTEVLLELLINYTLNEVMELIEGMYAFCFLDVSSGKAILSRDIFGQKPLYYYENENKFVFASTSSALKNMLPNIDWTISNESIQDYLSTGFIIQPKSVYSDIKQLKRGEIIKVDFSNSNKIIIDCSQLNTRVYTYSENNNLDEVIKKSVDKCLVSDVEVGAFLSGGIDSSLISYYANRTGNLKSFCLGFEGKSYDESDSAKAISDRIGTEHYTYNLSDEEVYSIANKSTDIFCEPFSDPSFIPLVAISRFAKEEKNIKVALTGDGGDEIFYGYNRHIYSKKINFFRNKKILKLILSNLLRNPKLINTILSPLGYNAVYDKISKLNMMLNNDSKSLYWNFFISNRVGFHPSDYIDFQGELVDLIRNMDIEFYQTSNTLVKSDRSSMYSGLELRAPLLEKEVLQYANSNVNSNSEIKLGTGKLSLRNLAYELIGRDLLDRPKAGFTPPLVDWIKGPLNSWATSGLSYLDKSSLKVGDSPTKLNNYNDDYLYSLHIWRLSILGHWINSV